MRIASIFNTYGERMHESDGRVVSNFIVQALTGKPLTLYGDGSQTRSFCYVSDLIDGLIRLMAKDGFTGPVNLGNPHEISVAALAQRIISLAGSRSTIEYRPLPENDPQRRQPDIALARRELGWEPSVALDDGLRRTIEYFQTIIHGATGL